MVQSLASLGPQETCDGGFRLQDIYPPPGFPVTSAPKSQSYFTSSMALGLTGRLSSAAVMLLDLPESQLLSHERRRIETPAVQPPRSTS